MGRKMNSSEFEKLIYRMRAIRQDIAITTDIIVGFPGETEAQFQNTYNLLAELKMDVAHLARYSPRPGTYSARFLVDDVPDKEKLHRFRMLEDLQEKISAEINSTYMNKQVKVLFEGRSKNRWRGRTPTNKLVFVESAEELLGQERLVKINWTGPWSMLGELD
jgi:tRNA-2-methylthio-N6-dimethylallyladenosine synthase